MSRYISSALKQQIRSQFGDRCAYCQTAEALTVSTFEIEHITPLVAGGETEVGNLCLACPACNRHKATRPTAIDPDTQQPVDLFHPQQQTWAEHFAWSEDGTEILGLTVEPPLLHLS